MIFKGALWELGNLHLWDVLLPGKYHDHWETLRAAEALHSLPVPYEQVIFINPLQPLVVQHWNIFIWSFKELILAYVVRLSLCWWYLVYKKLIFVEDIWLI